MAFWGSGIITRPLEFPPPEPELDFQETDAAELEAAAAAGVCGGVVWVWLRLLEAAATNEGGKYC